VLGERSTRLLELALGHESAARAPDRDRRGRHDLAGRPASPPETLGRRHETSLDVCKHAERSGRLQAVTTIQTETQRLLTVAEVAAQLRVSPWTIYRRAADGSLPALRVGAGGPLRFTADAVETLLRPAPTHALETKETT